MHPHHAYVGHFLGSALNLVGALLLPNSQPPRSCTCQGHNVSLDVRCCNYYPSFNISLA